MTDTDPLTFAYRFLSGRPLDGVRRTDGGYLRRGRAVPGQHASAWARRPGWHRQVARLGTLTVLCTGGLAYAKAPTVTEYAAAAFTLVAAVYGIHRLRRW